jgi:hypothetical protein
VFMSAVAVPLIACRITDLQKNFDFRVLFSLSGNEIPFKLGGAFFRLVNTISKNL